MKGKKRLIALLLSFLMVMSQMSVATFALDTVAADESDQAVTEQAVEETQPDADVTVAAVETEPEATESVTETATEPEAAEPAAAEPEKAEPAAEPAKAEAKKAEPKKEEPKEEAFDQSKTVDGVKVTVKAAKGVFPAGSKLSVSSVSVPSAVDAEDAEEAYAFDISILADGKKIQPDGKAEVSFTTAEVAKYDTEVYHMDGNKAEELSVSESGKTATVKTDGFSSYVVVFSAQDPDDQTKTNTYQLDVGETIRVCGEYDYGNTLLGKLGYGSVVAYSVNVNGQDLEYNSNSNTLKVKNYFEGTETIVVNNSITVSITTPEIAEVTFSAGDAEEQEGFHSDTMPEPQAIPANTMASEPKNEPVWDNHTFLGWFAGSDTKPFDFENRSISADTVLTAHWSHEHEWNVVRSADKNTLTVNCTYEECPYYAEKKVSLDAPDMTYTGDQYSEDGIQLKPEEGFYEEFGAELGPIVQYKGKTLDGEDYVSPVAPTEAGSYRVKVAIENNGPEVRYLWDDFRIIPAKIEVTKPTAITGLVYNTTEQKLAENGAVASDIAHLKYAVNKEETKPTEGYEESLETLKQVNAGPYNVWYQAYDEDEEVFDDSNYVFVDVETGEEIDFNEPIKVIVDKAEPIAEAPAPLENLYYTGEDQVLIEAGTQTYPEDPSAPEIKYSLSEDAGYSQTLPSGNGAKKYDVYYKAEENTNYKAVGPVRLVAEILSKGDPTGAIKGRNKTYNGTDLDLVVVTKPAENGTFYYSLDNVVYTNEIPTAVDAGTYTVYYYIKGNEGYNDTPVDSVTATIKKRPITVKANDATITFGEAFKDAEVGYTVKSGKFVSEEDQAEFDAAISYSSNYDRFDSVTGDYDITPLLSDSYKSNSNYDPTLEDGSLTVDPYPVTVTWPSEKDRTFTYDGRSHKITADLSGTMDLRLIDWLNIRLSYTYANTDPDAEDQDAVIDAGKYKATAVLEGTGCENYTIVDKNGKPVEKSTANIRIKPKEVTVSWEGDGHDPCIYDGNTHYVVATIDTPVSGEVLLPVYNGDQSAVNKGVYVGSVIGIQNEEGGAPTKISNYVLVDDEGNKIDENNPSEKEWQIFPREITVAWPSQTEYVYNGATQTITPSFNNVVEGDNLKPVYRDDSVTSAKDVGTYEGKVIGIEAADEETLVGNYTLVADSGAHIDESKPSIFTWSITPATVTVTANNQTIYTDQNIDKTAVSYAGFLGGDTEAVLTSKATVTSNYEPFGKAGKYTLKAGGAAAKNYEFKYVNGNLTVKEKAYLLLVKAQANGNNEANVLWARIPDADRYLVYYTPCGNEAFKLYKTVGKNCKYCKVTGLHKGGIYRFKIIAQKWVNGRYKNFAYSNTAHMVAGDVSGNFTNAKYINVNAKSLTLTKGQRFVIKTNITKVYNDKSLLNWSHGPKLSYMSSNPEVAAVSSNGVIVAKGKGTCKVYAYAANGIWKGITVTVK